MSTDAPGAAWNAGLERPTADLAICVDAGDTLAEAALSLMTDLLPGSRASAFVSPGVEWVGPGTSRSTSAPPGCSTTQLLADPQAAHISALFTWSSWEAGHGFDESMDALEHVDFWLGMLASGAVGLVEERPLLRRRVHDRALYKASWGTPGYRQAADLLYERHVHRADPAELLYLKEAIARQERRRLQDRQGRRDRTSIALAEARRQHDALIALLPEPHRAVDLGSFNRRTPLSHQWGYERGTPADRPLIERFLAAHREDITGLVLEVQEDDYARAFGGPGVVRTDVLDVNCANPRATLIADLRDAPQIPDDTYDCVILTQTLHVIDDMPGVLAECRRILKPTGVLLATVPCASRGCLEYGPDGDFWRATESGVRRLFQAAFGPGAVDTFALGNAPLNAAFSLGLAAQELPANIWEFHDPYFPLLVGVRASGSRAGVTRRSLKRSALAPRGVVLMYHRVADCDVDPHHLCVSPRRFREQVDWLKASYPLVPFEALASHSVDGPAVALTFDDGYVDNLEQAVPVLLAASTPATFFLTTASGPDPYCYWWDQVARLLVFPGNRITIELPSGGITLELTTPALKQAAAARIHRELVPLPPAVRDRIVEDVRRAIGDVMPPGCRRMTWDEARVIASHALFELGGHTVDHLLLPAQPDAVVVAQLADCRQTIANETGRLVSSLAYPFGAFDERTMAAARDAGFARAVTCVSRATHDLDDPLALPRLEVVDEPLAAFARRLEYALGTRVQ
ncbi:MAG: polysaccharide deacetylase family protein [Vicinamibacterales bacterium]